MGHFVCWEQDCGALTSVGHRLPGAVTGLRGLRLTWGQTNPGGQVNDGWTMWPRRVVVESGHSGAG